MATDTTAENKARALEDLELLLKTNLQALEECRALGLPTAEIGHEDTLKWVLRQVGNLVMFQEMRSRGVAIAPVCELLRGSVSRRVAVAQEIQEFERGRRHGR